MLDRAKLISQLERVAHDLFADDTPIENSLYDIWCAITQDSLFLHKVKQVVNPPWPVPLWDGDLGKIILTQRIEQSHIAFSVDGSQIYPDRHHTISCFLINTGVIVLPYGVEGKRVAWYSEPMVFTGAHNEIVSVSGQQAAMSVDFVNCKRQELEMRMGLEVGITLQQEHATIPQVLLFDGSLIFWHLSSKDPELRDYFLHTYLALLDNLFHEKIITAWYISMPKSKELINLMRLHLSHFDVLRVESWKAIDRFTDSAIMNMVLQPLTRSIVFFNRSSISAYYSRHLSPCFFYIHTGHEIGRVEVPQWIANDEKLLDLVAQVVIDQCIKGDGYPIALAEAHEQAVVKGVDRDFFYHFLQKMGIERNRSFCLSRKNIKKRGMGF